MNQEAHITDQIAAYALHALEAAEAARVADHLANCPDCLAELHAYEAVLDQLALLYPEATPSQELKQQLMQEIELPKKPEPSPKSDGLFNWRRWLPQRPLWQPALALILIALLVISNIQLRQQLNAATTPANFGTIPLTNPEATNPASGILIISDDGRHGTLVVQNLPQLPDSETYQLWLIKDGQRTDGGIFNVADDGYRAHWVQSPEPLNSYQDFGITIEPAGGSPGPTGEKVLGN